MRSRKSLIVPLFLLITLGCRSQKSPPMVPSGFLEDERISECSGMVASVEQPGVFWVHNDSGDAPRIFAVDRQGKLLQEVGIEGAKNVDWEDIAIDKERHLFIGDFGNNRNNRRDLVVYVIAEPEVEAGGGSQVVPVLRRLPFYYPEQKAYPDPENRNFDCESMVWNHGYLYLFTKHRSDSRTVLYRLDPGSSIKQAAQKLGEFDAGSMVTAADISADGKNLLLLSYDFIYVFEWQPENDRFLEGDHHRMTIEGRQCESICSTGKEVIFTNEQREIFRLNMDTLKAAESFLPERPRVQLTQDLQTLRLHADLPVQDGEAGKPQVRLAWSETGLLLDVSYPHAGGQLAARRLLDVMFGPSDGISSTLRPQDVVMTIHWDGDSIVRQTAEESPHRVEAKPSDDRFAFQVDLPWPGGRPSGDAIAFNVLAYPLAEADVSWAWAGSASMRPLENPLLWGIAELRRHP